MRPFQKKDFQFARKNETIVFFAPKKPFLVCLKIQIWLDYVSNNKNTPANFRNFQEKNPLKSAVLKKKTRILECPTIIQTKRRRSISAN